MYFRGQGKAYLGLRDSNGNPLALRWVGNCPELKIGMSIDYIEHQESYTGQAQTDLKIVKSKSTSLNFTLEDFNKANLALALSGTANDVAASTAITGEVLNGSTTPAVGHVYTAAKRNGTTVAVKDSTGTPKTLTKDTNYSIEPYSMTIELLNISTGGPFVGPLKVDYTPGAMNEIAMFNAASTEYFLRFVGMNMADSGKIVTVDLFKVQLSPTTELNMVAEDLATLPMEGAALIDLLRPSSATLGQFGAIYQQQ